MRGKTKAATRYTAFRKKMLETFRTEEGVKSDFIAFLRINEDLQWALALYTEDETLSFLQPGAPTAVYQILRLADKPVLLRQLEPLADYIWGETDGKGHLYTALTVLYSANLVDYQLRDFESSPSNILQFFVKEDV